MVASACCTGNFLGHGGQCCLAEYMQRGQKIIAEDTALFSVCTYDFDDLPFFVAQLFAEASSLPAGGCVDVSRRVPDHAPHGVLPHLLQVINLQSEVSQSRRAACTHTSSGNFPKRACIFTCDTHVKILISPYHSRCAHLDR